jgi:adenylate kinase family enzyme
VTTWEQPTVLVVTGLPGTGKSTLAERVAKAAGAPAFSVDWLLGAIAPSGVLNDARHVELMKNEIEPLHVPHPTVDAGSRPGRT